LERNLLGVLPLGTIGEGLNLNEWFRLKSRRWRSGVSLLVYVAHISSLSFYCLVDLSTVDVVRRVYNQAMSRVYISLCHFGFYSILLSLSTNDVLLASFIAVCDRTSHLGPGTGQDHGRRQVGKGR